MKDETTFRYAHAEIRTRGQIIIDNPVENPSIEYVIMSDSVTYSFLSVRQSIIKENNDVDIPILITIFIIEC